MNGKRFVLSFSRVTSRDSSGKPATHVREYLDLIHPDDKNGKGVGWFHDLKSMVSGKDYFDVKTEQVECAQ